MNEITIAIIASTFLILILVVFVVVISLLHQKRQQAHHLEKANLESQFNQEILTSKNEVQENTMKHISRELHDNVGQLLSLVKVQLNNIEEENPNINRINESREYLDNAMRDIRALSKSLNSENILRAGFVEGIKFELTRIQKTGVIKTHFEDETVSWNIQAKIEIILYRIFQELVQNIIKHAKAKSLTIRLLESDECYKLVILDDGIGFELSKKTQDKSFSSGAGLANISNRAKLLSGELKIESIIGQGTTVSLLIPKKPNDKRRPS